jgi:hypothetical protein
MNKVNGKKGNDANVISFFFESFSIVIRDYWYVKIIIGEGKKWKHFK